MIRMTIKTTTPMNMLTLMFCHHIFRDTLRAPTRNSSALFDNISDLSSKFSKREPLSRILSMFSCIIFETSFTCSLSL